jgi:hypothetical protein
MSELKRTWVRYHGFDPMIWPEEMMFWREAIKAKFHGGKKFTIDDWYVSTPPQRHITYFIPGTVCLVTAGQVS